MRAVILLLLAACAARQLPPEPPIMVTSLRERDEATEPHAACIAPATRARIADCSVVRVVTSADVTAKLDASERAIIGRPAREPPASEGSKRSKREEREEERRMLLPLELLPEQEDAVRTLTSWVCLHPDDYVTTFRLARLHFEHRRFEEAISYFARVVETAPLDDDIGANAFMREMETESILAVHFERLVCYDEIEAKIGAIRDRICALELVARHPDRVADCTKIGRINADVDLMHVREGIY